MDTNDTCYNYDVQWGLVSSIWMIRRPVAAGRETKDQEGLTYSLWHIVKRAQADGSVLNIDFLRLD